MPLRVLSIVTFCTFNVEFKMLSRLVGINEII